MSQAPKVKFLNGNNGNTGTTGQKTTLQLFSSSVLSRREDGNNWGPTTPDFSELFPCSRCSRSKTADLRVDHDERLSGTATCGGHGRLLQPADSSNPTGLRARPDTSGEVFCAGTV
jgi:hypothetical protein